MTCGACVQLVRGGQLWPVRHDELTGTVEDEVLRRHRRFRASWPLGPFAWWEVLHWLLAGAHLLPAPAVAADVPRTSQPLCPRLPSRWSLRAAVRSPTIDRYGRAVIAWAKLRHLPAGPRDPPVGCPPGIG